jgi:hypothetical protein
MMGFRRLITAAALPLGALDGGAVGRVLAQPRSAARPIRAHISHVVTLEDGFDFLGTPVFETEAFGVERVHGAVPLKRANPPSVNRVLEVQALKEISWGNW